MGDDEEEQVDRESRELRKVRRWRTDEALRAGLTAPEAALFADGDQDLSLLRRLRRLGASGEQIARIVT